LLTKIEPRFGTRLGGEKIKFTGTNFDSDHTKYTIMIDGAKCTTSAASSTFVECTTGKKDGVVKPLGDGTGRVFRDFSEQSLSIVIDGRGKFSNNDLLFTYVFKWSDGQDTWLGEFAPMDDESVHIPKGFNLLVDIDTGPKLKFVLVEGGLIFPPDKDPNHHRQFNAKYIFVNGGRMEMGTAEFPYTSKLTVTMRSKIDDPYLPIYGNKCIGLRYGTLDMHGVAKTPTWTVMEKTVEKGATKIQL